MRLHTLIAALALASCSADGTTTGALTQGDHADARADVAPVDAGQVEPEDVAQEPEQDEGLGADVADEGPVDAGCSPGQTGCDGSRVVVCGSDGSWADGPECEQGCVDGVCAKCAPGSVSCWKNREVGACRPDGQGWTTIKECSVWCRGGKCTEDDPCGAHPTCQCVAEQCGTEASLCEKYGPGGVGGCWGPAASAYLEHGCSPPCGPVTNKQVPMAAAFCSAKECEDFPGPSCYSCPDWPPAP